MILIHPLVEQEQVRGAEHVDEVVTRQNVLIPVLQAQVIHVLLVPVGFILKVKACEFRRQDVAEVALDGEVGKGEQVIDDKVVLVEVGGDICPDLAEHAVVIHVQLREFQLDTDFLLHNGVALKHCIVDHAGCRVLLPLNEVVGVSHTCRRNVGTGQDAEFAPLVVHILEGILFGSDFRLAVGFPAGRGRLSRVACSAGDQLRDAANQHQEAEEERKKAHCFLPVHGGMCCLR